MISRWVWLLPLGLTLSCARPADDGIIARAGQAALTKDEFRAWAGASLDSVSAEIRWTVLSEWAETAQIEQEVRRVNLTEDPALRMQQRKLQARLFRAALLARTPSAPVTQQEIADYYDAHKSEFRKPRDSFLIESFWCESRDSLAQFRRALGKADTSGLRSGFVIWEGKWLADQAELEPQALSEIRKLASGGLSPVMPYGEGFRLVRLVETYPSGSQLSLEAAAAEIQERLLIEISQRRQEQWNKELRTRYPIEVLWEERPK